MTNDSDKPSKETRWQRIGKYITGAWEPNHIYVAHLTPNPIVVDADPPTLPGLPPASESRGEDSHDG